MGAREKASLQAGQENNAQGSSGGSKVEGQMEVIEGQGQGSSGGGMGDEDDDHLFNPGDLCIDSGTDERSQEDEDKKEEGEERFGKVRDIRSRTRDDI